jgi:hypothetical protein
LRIQFPSGSFPGSRPQEAAGRLINALAEPIGEGRATPFKIIRSPGVAPFTNPGALSTLTGFRGMAYMRGTIYAAYKDNLVKFTEAAPTMTVVAASPPALAGTGPVFFATDQNATPHNVLVPANNGGAYVFDAASVSATPIVGVSAAIDVTYGLGFFYYALANGQCFSSTLPNTADSGPFVTAESKADQLRRCVWFQDQLYLMGTQTIEIYGKPINIGAGQFPLTKVTTVQRGIISNKAVTAYEDGIDLGIVFVANNYQVCRLNGYLPERISTPDIERAIQATVDKAQIECTSFIVDTHVFMKIKSPEWCWFYDFTTQKWHERQSYLSVTSRLLQAIYTGARWLIADSNSNIIGEAKPAVYTEFTSPLMWRIDSVPIQAFPNRVVCGPAHFNFVTGTGIVPPPSPELLNPTLQVAWSDDGGTSFCNPVVRPFGMSQRVKQLITVYLTGSFGPQGRVWRLTCTDAVYVSLLDGDMPRIAKREAA